MEEMPEDIQFAILARQILDEDQYEDALARGDAEVIRKLDAAYEAGRRAGVTDGVDEVAYPTIPEEVAYKKGYQAGRSTS